VLLARLPAPLKPVLCFSSHMSMPLNNPLQCEPHGLARPVQQLGRLDDPVFHPMRFRQPKSTSASHALDAPDSLPDVLT